MNKEAIDPMLLQFNEYLRSELRTLTSFFFNWLPVKKVFGKIYENEINKLTVLMKAQELGISIPKTYICTKRDEFNEISKSERLITKSISNSPSIHIGNETFLAYTTICNEIPSEIEDSFSPSLFQNLIKKKYEIRAFFLSGKIYSMAIFSQADTQTEIDFRHYNYNNPNRTVPIKLPSILESKLLVLAEFFQLKTGSFDLIKTLDNNYIFLEVNPSGQFGMVSFPCNYYLEKKIAQELINHGYNAD